MNLITQFLPTLMPTALNLTKNKHDAEDLLQETALKILLNKDKIEKMADTAQQKYAYTMLRNSFIDTCRKKKEFTCHVPERSEQSNAETILGAKEVRQAMQNINPKHKKMLDLSLSGFKMPEIAKHMDISVFTILSGVRYGKNAVRAALS